MLLYVFTTKGNDHTDANLRDTTHLVVDAPASDRSTVHAAIARILDVWDAPQLTYPKYGPQWQLTSAAQIVADEAALIAELAKAGFTAQFVKPAIVTATV